MLPCSNEMTVTYDRQRGVEIIRKPVGKAPWRVALPHPDLLFCQS